MPRATENDDECTWFGDVTQVVTVSLDESDEPVRTMHDLARLLLLCTDQPLDNPCPEFDQAKADRQTAADRDNERMTG